MGYKKEISKEKKKKKKEKDIGNGNEGFIYWKGKGHYPTID